MISNGKYLIALFDRGDWSIHIGFFIPAILNEDVINKHVFRIAYSPFNLNFEA